MANPQQNLKKPSELLPGDMLEVEYADLNVYSLTTENKEPRRVAMTINGWCITECALKTTVVVTLYLDMLTPNKMSTAAGEFIIPNSINEYARRLRPKKARVKKHF